MITPLTTRSTRVLVGRGKRSYGAVRVAAWPTTSRGQAAATKRMAIETRVRYFSTEVTQDIPECDVGVNHNKEEGDHLEVSSLVTELMRPSFDDQTPLVLRNLLSATPKNARALQTFSDWDYWEDQADDNHSSNTIDCHVELGGNYSQSEIADVPLAEFVSYLRYFEARFGRSAATNPDGPDNNLPEASDLIYLAQNDIFPQVLEDIDIPILSSADQQQQSSSSSKPLGEGSLYSTMIWMGAYGCVSPLHYDPLDNLLMQFVGTKKVFVCAPNAQVHAGSNGNQVNTSSLNPEVTKERQQSGVSFLQTTLHPGDALYIPKKWFHHIRTVETSVSINTWFR